MNSTAGSGAVDMTGPLAPLDVIIGPTAAGKSAVALALAMTQRLAIVSADSRQVYRGFDIGTAKPSAADRANVPHYGIDVVEPTERYSAHAWAHDALGWIDEARQSERHAVIVGGTGFYVRALVRPLDAVPALEVTRRKRLEQWLAVQDLGTLQRWCRRLDPARAALGRSQLLRAIETALLTGQQLSTSYREATTPRAARYLVVDPGASLGVRIRQRVEAMIASGWVDEVQRLVNTVPADAPAWLASGYGVMRDHVEGRLSLEAAMERVVIETRQYAKRQRTWCRHQLADGTVTHLDPTLPDAHERALAWWNDRSVAS